MSIRETILSAAETALLTITAVDSRVYRSRVTAFQKADFPSIVLEPVSDNPDNPTVSRIQWALTFQVSVLVRSNTTDETADSIVASVHNKILSDSTLDSLCVNLLPGNVNWQTVDADTPLGIVSMQFSASYQTSFQNIAI